MPLFSKSATTFRAGVKDLDGDRFKHIEKMIVQGKAVGRAPEMAGTTVVFMPYPNFDNPKYKEEVDVLPDRLSDDPMDYSRWMFYADGVSRFGKNPVTILFDDPDDSGFVPSEHNPVHMIYEAVDRALHAGQVIDTPFGTSESDNWRVLLKGDQDKKIFPVISRPDQLVMAYALIYSSGKKSYFMEGAPFGSADTDLPVVFVMSRYAVTKSLVPRLEAGGTDGRPLIENVTGTKFIHFYDRQKSNCQAMNNAAAAQATVLGAGRRQSVPLAGGDNSGTQLAGYGVYVSDTLTGLPDAPRLSRKDVARLSVDRLRPWEDTLRGHTPEASARLISGYCGLPMSILYYAWKSMPQYYSEELKHRLRNPKTVETRPPAASSNPAHAGLGLPSSPPSATPAVPTVTSGEYDLPGGESDDSAGPSTWDGQVGDPTGAEHDRGAGDGPPEAEILAYDPKAVADAKAKFREYMAGQQSAAAAARSSATKPDSKPKK